MSLPFRFYFRVRYAECDAQKVVFNARYGDYVDLGFTEFLRALGYGGQALLDSGSDFQLVRQTFEWKGSARYDQVLELSQRVTHLGNTSFTLSSEFRRAGESQVFATAETVYVHVDSRSLAKQPLTSSLRAVLGHGAAGTVVDHAAYLK
jgi:acyl-CoA thioester hydrolase